MDSVTISFSRDIWFKGKCFQINKKYIIKASYNYKKKYATLQSGAR